MKKIITYAIISNFILINSSFSLTLEEIKEPADLMNRANNSQNVEARKTQNNCKNVQEETKKAQIETTDTTDKNSTAEVIQANSTYADLSLKKLANDVSVELEMDELDTTSDLSTLWNATTQRSETMKYTIYKLSNPDEDKPNDSVIKKILRPVANLSSIAGVSVAGDPFVATGALIGGGLVNAFMKDDKEANYQFSKVSDADMVLLIRKIDMLQKKLIDLYMDYKTKQKLYEMEQDNFKKREDIYKLAQNKSKEELTIADVYYRNAKIKTQKALDEYLTSRAVLENLVGTDAINKIEEKNDPIL